MNPAQDDLITASRITSKEVVLYDTQNKRDELCFNTSGVNDTVCGPCEQKKRFRDEAEIGYNLSFACPAVALFSLFVVRSEFTIKPTHLPKTEASQNEHFMIEQVFANMP